MSNTKYGPFRVVAGSMILIGKVKGVDPQVDLVLRLVRVDDGVYAYGREGAKELKAITTLLAAAPEMLLELKHLQKVLRRPLNDVALESTLATLALVINKAEDSSHA